MKFKEKYEIKKQYLQGPSRRRPKIAMPSVEFAVAHDTGNPGSTAQGNVNYYNRSRNDMSASAHIFVDDKEIIECIPLLTETPEKAWHVRYNVTIDNRMYGDDANDVAGGVEMCWGKGIDSEESYKRYVWVLAYLCFKFGLDPSKKIVGHEILDPGRKIDPSNGLRYMGKTYDQLRKDIVDEYNECTKSEVEKPEPKPVRSEFYTIKSGDTLWGIAHNHQKLSVNQLLAWNPDLDPHALKIGQKIRLQPPKKEPKQKPVVAKPTPGKKPVEVPGGILKKGHRGPDVLKLQKALSAVYFYPDKGAKDNGCDGWFGDKTENALMRFQSIYANPVDGIYGPKTAEALKKRLRKLGK